MAGMTSLVGAGLGLAGSLMGGSSGPKYRPMDTSNLWGDVSFNKKKRLLTQTLSPFAQQMANQFQTAATGAGANPLGQMGFGMQMGAAGQMPGLYDAAQNFGMLDPAIYETAMSGMGQYAGAFGNLFSQAAVNPFAQQQMGLGLDLLGSQAASYGDVANQRLGLLRQNAAPFEERALNALGQSAFGRGRLGSTGGGRDVEAFARGLSQADTGRQLEAQTFAEQLYGRDQSAALQRQGLGANLFAGGVGNYLSGLGQAGQFGQLGMGALGGMYDLGANYNQMGYTRAQDRMARAEGMFGFGTQLENIPRQQQATYMNLLSGITQEQANLANLGRTSGGPGEAQVNPTQQALGGFLQGLGGGMLQNPGGFFGNKFTQPTGPASIPGGQGVFGGVLQNLRDIPMTYGYGN